jgi:hypothetical protein
VMTLIFDYKVGGRIGYAFGVLGLFVPFGILSTLTLVHPFGWASVVFFIVAMFYLSNKLNSRDLSPMSRIIINLALLLLITFVVDLIRLTPLGSWELLQAQGRFRCC